MTAKQFMENSSAHFPPRAGIFRKFLKNSGGAERKNLPVFYPANQGEADAIAASLTARETAINHQRGRVHQAMSMVLNAVDAAGGNQLPWLERYLSRSRFCF